MAKQKEGDIKPFFFIKFYLPKTSFSFSVNSFISIIRSRMILLGYDATCGAKSRPTTNKSAELGFTSLKDVWSTETPVIPRFSMLFQHSYLPSYYFQVLNHSST